MSLKKQSTLLLTLLVALLLTSCDSGGSSSGNGTTAQTPSASGTTAQTPAGKSKLNGVPPSQIVAKVHTVKSSSPVMKVRPSPAGGKVLISSLDDNNNAIFNVVDLTSAGASSTMSITTGIIRPDDLRWTPDGNAFALAALDKDASAAPAKLHIVDMQKVTDTIVPLESGTGAAYPLWSSDSNNLYFLAFKQNYSADMMQVGRDGQGARVLFHIADNIDQLVASIDITPNDKQFVFGTGETSHSTTPATYTPVSITIYLADTNGENRRKLGETNMLYHLQVSPRGDAVLVERGPDLKNMANSAGSFILPLDPNLGGKEKPLPLPPIADSDKANVLENTNDSATWSPDGDKVAYLAHTIVRGLTANGLWIALADGSSPTEVYSTTDSLQAQPTLTWANDDTITFQGSGNSFTVIQLEKKQ